MPAGGKLIIETRNVELDGKYASRHPSAVPGRFAMLTISDTGDGMDAQTQARIFEPFFTTKELGKGTGLGLATVHGIVKQSGGWIWVYSELGAGTTLKVYLPQIERPAESKETDPIDFSVPCGAETILLVEDQDGIRALAGEAPLTNGYTVLEASNGREPCEMASRLRAIDLLVTDVAMPHMGGRELSDRLSSTFQHMKVLYTSGYTECSAKKRGVLGENMVLLQKPSSMGALVRKVRDVLDSRDAALDV